MTSMTKYRSNRTCKKCGLTLPAESFYLGRQVCRKCYSNAKQLNSIDRLTLRNQKLLDGWIR